MTKPKKIEVSNPSSMTRWRAKVKSGSLTRPASRSHIDKSEQARMTHNYITQLH